MTKATRPKRRIGGRRTRRRSPDESVVLVSDAFDWPQELVASLREEGYEDLRVATLALVPHLLRNGHVKALLVGARPLGGKDLQVVRECREVSPGTAVVVTTTTPSQPDLKRAFESGATAFLSWPASPDVVRQALGSGRAPAPPVERAARKKKERT